MPELLLKVVDIATAAQVIDREPMAEIVESERSLDQFVADGALDQQVELAGDVVVPLPVMMPEDPARGDVRRCADNCAGRSFIKRDRSRPIALGLPQIDGAGPPGDELADAKPVG